MTNIHDRLPNEKPTNNGDLILKQEVKYELILEWTKNGASLNLYLRNHSEHPEIVPDEPMECQQHDRPTNPSTLQDLPTHLQQQFRDTARIIKNKYNLSNSTDCTCTLCFPQKGDGTLQFTQFFD